MKNYWEQLINYLRYISEEFSDCVNSGASEKEIEKLEEKLNVAFPEDFKSFYQIHNGQRTDKFGMVPSGMILPLNNILSQLQIWKKIIDSGAISGIRSEPELGVKNDWYNLNWIPITSDGSGNHLCMDLDPAEGGRIGQIITVEHDSPERFIVAPSFEDWIQNIVNEFKDGEYKFDKYCGIFERNK